MKLLVAGGAGFIGSNFVRQRALENGDEVVVYDKLTYAGRESNIEGTGAKLIVAGIEDRDAMLAAVDGVDAVVNFAAETHVDRSIQEPDAFVKTHALGTYSVVEACRTTGVPLVQISTDEVYGSILEGSFTEESPIEGNSPYSATKAGGDLLVQSYFTTFGTDVKICRGSNSYGPYQYPEKLIPLMILNALRGDKLPVYGDGLNVRNWLFVEDFARGISAVLEGGKAGEVYNVGGPSEAKNIDVVNRIVELVPGADESLIEFVEDRPGHDRRYSLSAEKLKREIGWEAAVQFDEGIEKTVKWYLDNKAWWEPIIDGDYRAYYERQYGTKIS
ncbi:MAG: dTDP-glucose 4,6-dehydratase [Solirubrobacteraceae bacterium]|nr:dTDP-glucose 4,6-dehydratase [Solirubrobacteraceae bacterium]